MPPNSSNDQEVPVFKVCIVGDIGVGKTSLVRRYVDRRFTRPRLTIEAETIKHKQVLVQGIKILLQFWVAPPRITEHLGLRISRTFYNYATGVVLCFNLNRVGTGSSISEDVTSGIERYYNEVATMVYHPATYNPPAMLYAAEVDLTKQ